MSSSESIATPSRPTSPERARMVGVVAHQRRHVERGREAGLAVVEQVAEALVRLLGGAEAGELPHRPELAAVHRRIDAARERDRRPGSRGRARSRPSTVSGVTSGSFSSPEMVEKSSPWRSGVRSYSSSRQACVASSESRSSVVAMPAIVFARGRRPARASSCAQPPLQLECLGSGHRFGDPGLPVPADAPLPRKGDLRRRIPVVTRLSSQALPRSGRCAQVRATHLPPAREGNAGLQRGDQRRTAAFEAPGTRRVCLAAPVPRPGRDRAAALPRHARTPRRARGAHAGPLPDESLGEERAAPLAPVPAGNATARIDAGRLVVQGPQHDRVALAALVGGAPGWRRHAGGEWRATPVRLRGDHARHRRPRALPDRRPPRRPQDLGVEARDDARRAAAAERRRRLRRPGQPPRLRPDDRPRRDLRCRAARTSRRTALAGSSAAAGPSS